MAVQLLVLIVFPALLILAAASDLFTMTIPNAIPAAIAIVFVPAAWVAGLPLEVFFWHCAAGLAMLAVAFFLFSMGWIGGGDAKLFAATALWLGWGELGSYVFVVSVLGGFLTLALLFARRLPMPATLYGQDWLARLHDARTGVPYGIALAAGALLVHVDGAWMARALG